MLRLACLAARTAWPRLRTLPADAALALGGAVGDQPASGRRFWTMLAVILPVASLTWVGLSQVTLVMSPSIDAWAVRPAPGPIARGDLVQFMLSHPVAGPRPVSVTKRALCLPGERLREIERPAVDGKPGKRHPSLRPQRTGVGRSPLGRSSDPARLYLCRLRSCRRF